MTTVQFAILIATIYMTRHASENLCLFGAIAWVVVAGVLKAAGG